jgi:hypothetical protein
MIDFLRNNVIGVLGDNSEVLSYGNLYRLYGSDFWQYIGYPHGNINATISPTEPILSWFIFLFLRVDSVLFYNFLVIAAFALAYITSFYFFRYFLKNPVVSVFMATIFTFSPYFYYRTRSHLALSQFWLVPPFILALINAKKLWHFALIGLYLAIMTLISNYLGYFSALFTAIYFFVKGLAGYFSGVKYWSRNVLLGYFLMVMVFAVFMGVFMRAHIAVNYDSLEDGSYREHGFRVDRPYEDFFIFSSRPWHYFLPSVSNPFFGHLSQQTLDFLWNDWQYFLAQKIHYETEHTASYLGWVNFILAGAGCVWIIRRWREKIEILVLGIVGIALVVVSMPPYMTISGLTVYMPSQLLLEVFPMFRTLTRLGVIVLLIQLIFTGFGYLMIIDWFKSKFKLRVLPYLVVTPLLVFSLAEFFVPIKITNIFKPSCCLYVHI